MIKAGTVWRAHGQSLTFTRDISHGDAVTPKDILLDDCVMTVAANLPRWALTDGYLRLTPPDGVEVTACSSMMTSSPIAPTPHP